MDPYTMQTSFSEVRTSSTLPRSESDRTKSRRYSEEPPSSPNIMFTSTASIQLSQASRVGPRGGRRSSSSGPNFGMAQSGEYYFDEEFSVPFDANLIAGTPLDEDSLQAAASRHGVERDVTNLHLVNSRSDGCLFYPDLTDELDDEVDQMGHRLSSGPMHYISGASVTSTSTDRLTGVSNLEEQTSWNSGTPATLETALLRRVPEYKLIYETSGSQGFGGANSTEGSPHLSRSRKGEIHRTPSTPRQVKQYQQQQQQQLAYRARTLSPSSSGTRGSHSTWAEVAARRTHGPGGLQRWTSSQELSSHVSSDDGMSDSRRRLTTWGRIHSASSREKLNSPLNSSGATEDPSLLRTGTGTPAKTTWRQLRQQRDRLGPQESSSSNLLMARSRSMEHLNRVSRGVSTGGEDASTGARSPWLAPSAGTDSAVLDASVEEGSARYLRHQRVLGFAEFQQRARYCEKKVPSIMDSRSRLRRNSSAAATLTTVAREGRGKLRNCSGSSGAGSSSTGHSLTSGGVGAASRRHRASSQPPLPAKSRQLMVGLSASGLPDLSFLSSHLSRLKERAATEGERLRRTQSCQVLTTTETNHASPPASCDSGFDSNEQSTLLCKRCGSLTNVDREDSPRGPASAMRSRTRSAPLSQGLPSRHRSEPDLAQLYVHTDDIPIESAGAQGSSTLAPSSGRTTPLKSCLVSRGTPQGGTPTPGGTPVSGHAHRGSLDFTPGRSASPAGATGSAPGTRGSSPVSGHGSELKKSVSFSRAVRVQQAANQSPRSRPRHRQQSPPGDLKLVPTAVGIYGMESESATSYPGLMPTSDQSPSDDSPNGSSTSSLSNLDISQKRYKALVDDVMRSTNAAVMAFDPGATPVPPTPSTPRPNPLAMVAPLTTLVTDGLMPPGSAGAADSATVRLARAKTRLWPMVEESCRPGVSHRVLSEVLREVKNLSGITTDRAKFRAFLCSCLNNKALSLWLDSLVRNDALLRRFYFEDAFLRLASLHSNPTLPSGDQSSPRNSKTSNAVPNVATANVVRKLFHSELMSSLEKLLTLPYRLDISAEAKRSSHSDWLPSGPANQSTAGPGTPPKSPSRQPVRGRHDINTVGSRSPTVRRTSSGRVPPNSAGTRPVVGSTDRGRGRATMGSSPGTDRKPQPTRSIGPGPRPAVGVGQRAAPVGQVRRSSERA